MDEVLGRARWRPSPLCVACLAPPVCKRSVRTPVEWRTRPIGFPRPTRHAEPTTFPDHGRARHPWCRGRPGRRGTAATGRRPGAHGRGRPEVLGRRDAASRRPGAHALARGTLRARMPVEQAEGREPRRGHAPRSLRPPRLGPRAVDRTGAGRPGDEGRARVQLRRPHARSAGERGGPGLARRVELHQRAPAAGRRGVPRAGRPAGADAAARRARCRRRGRGWSRRSSPRALIPPFFNNWLLFSATVEAALRSLGAQLGPHARGLRAAPARAVVQGRRHLRRRTRRSTGTTTTAS